MRGKSGQGKVFLYIAWKYWVYFYKALHNKIGGLESGRLDTMIQLAIKKIMVLVYGIILSHHLYFHKDQNDGHWSDVYHYITEVF